MIFGSFTNMDSCFHEDIRRLRIFFPLVIGFDHFPRREITVVSRVLFAFPRISSSARRRYVASASLYGRYDREHFVEMYYRRVYLRASEYRAFSLR